MYVMQKPRLSRFAMYFDVRDWWIGYRRDSYAHYICLLPTNVIRIRRRRRARVSRGL